MRIREIENRQTGMLPRPEWELAVRRILDYWEAQHLAPGIDWEGCYRARMRPDVVADDALAQAGLRGQ